MSKIFVVTQNAYSQCADVGSVCAVFVGLGIASAGLHWAVSALLY